MSRKPAWQQQQQPQNAQSASPPPPQPRPTPAAAPAASAVSGGGTGAASFSWAAKAAAAGAKAPPAAQNHNMSAARPTTATTQQQQQQQHQSKRVPPHHQQQQQQQPQPYSVKNNSHKPQPNNQQKQKQHQPKQILQRNSDTGKPQQQQQYQQIQKKNSKKRKPSKANTNINNNGAANNNFRGNNNNNKKPGAAASQSPAPKKPKAVVGGASRQTGSNSSKNVQQLPTITNKAQPASFSMADFPSLGPSSSAVTSTTTTSAATKPPPSSAAAVSTPKPPVATAPHVSPPQQQQSKSSNNTKKKTNPNQKTTANTSKKQQERQSKKQRGNSSGGRSSSSSSAALGSAPLSSMFDPRPPPRDDTGDENVFLRLMQDRQVVVDVKKKGRQRLRPRKKKFSALKKKVLQERLGQWRESQQQKQNLNSSGTETTTASGQATADGDARQQQQSCTVCVYSLVETEELEDDDEYEEIMANLFEMASKIGEVRWVFIPRKEHIGETNSNVDNYRHPAFVEFVNLSDSHAAAACWDSLVVGGQPLEATCCKETAPESQSNRSEGEWWDWCLRTCSHNKDESKQEPHDSVGRGGGGTSTLNEVVIENALTEDDLEDDDCLEESVNDLRTLAQQFGTVVDIRVEKTSSPLLYVTYEGDNSVASHAVSELGKLVIGGSKVVARLPEPGGASDDEQLASVFLDNILSEEDLEDEECLEESLDDIRELAEKYGPVKSVYPITEKDGLTVRIDFSASDDVAEAAAEGFNGMTIGGSIVTASFSARQTTAQTADLQGNNTAVTPVQEKKGEPSPMFSGDKRIPERFAECKRAPKIPNSGQPRKYATLVNNDSVKPLLIEMLGELMRLQKRAIVDKNAKARRRIVMGLREVARGIRSNKVKMVVMANNLDEYGAIDSKLQEILDLANEAGVPVFFEFSKRGLGKALNKSIKIAVVGVQNADGAHQPFKKLLALAP